jgi:hypothetical protein
MGSGNDLHGGDYPWAALRGAGRHHSSLSFIAASVSTHDACRWSHHRRAAAGEVDLAGERHRAGEVTVMGKGG